MQESGSTELTPIRPQKLKNADLFHFGWNMAHYFGRPKQEVVPWLKSAFAPLAELEDSYIKGKLYSPQTRQFTIPNIPGYMAETAADFPFKKIFQGDFKEIASVFDLRKISLFICPGSDWTERTNPSLI